ncbi:MAG: NAD(P)H-hydrate dehydratase [Egibacteraceae bacterium]
MTPLFLPRDVRAMDERAFGRGVASLDLMERAAGHLARAVVDVAGRGYGLRVGVLCGKGNNGGDGVAAARRLRALGAMATVRLVDGEDGLSDDGRVQLDRWRALGGSVAPSAGAALEGADVAVDCLLGTGATGEPRGPYAAAVRALNAAPVPVVACDVPTGVDAETGRVPGEAVRADVTVTLGAHKLGLWLWPARGHAGRLVLGDLGIVDDGDWAAAHVLDRADAAALVPPAGADSHKRSRGVVAVLAGAPGMTGAATMTARGAMAAGAGLVTVITPATARHQIAPSVPEALTVDLPEDPDAAFAAVAEQAERADVLAVGPGLGLAGATQALVRRVVAEVGVAIVLDADGLNAFRDAGDELASHAAPLLVLTPHAKELGRLVGGSGHEVWGRRVELVRELAARWDAVLVAKGPGSLVGAPDGRLWVNQPGGAALATGGTGDVLTGITAALIARHPDPQRVAAAVHLHGLAGEEAAAASHPRSVTALDVVRAVPAALRRLDAAR